MGGSIHTHDPSAIAYVINPALFETDQCPSLWRRLGAARDRRLPMNIGSGKVERILKSVRA
jgi:hypothetical protein